MSKKYLIILTIQFIAIALLFTYALYKHTMVESARQHIATIEERAISRERSCEEETLELLAELKQVKEQLENCK